MSNRVDDWRRWFGTFFLILAGALLIWGQTLLKPHLKGISFVIYWLVCFGFTGLAVLTAMIDLWIMRRRTREQHRDLFRRTFAGLQRRDREEPPAGNTKPERKLE
ncbi:MAG: hypothetical protein HY674_01610 [Chloroflexi bacterium]|nr:hypothetical protein [Chloroflexota bacterium]